MRITNITLTSKCLLKSTAALAVVMSGIFPVSAAIAAEEAENQVFEEIVVMGTPGGAGLAKQDASFAITTLDADKISLAGVKSTAEIFGLVPGVWAESSGGVAGANIDVRGLPGGGDAPFVTMSINGSPIYGTEMLSFFEQSSIFRVDETVASAEALRGGPNAVFSNGEPGVTLNFNLKKGSEETEGRVKVSTSDYGLQRFDAVLSGPLGDEFYYMVGGYVQSSSGVRDAEFNSESGYQITAQLTKVLDNGEINVWSRVTDDHGQWYLPMALNSGSDLGTFSQLGNATRFRTLQVNANGDTKDFDFGDGRGWDGSVSGVNANFDLGNGFEVRDNMSYTKGDADTLGFVPDGSPVTVGALKASSGSATVSTLGGTSLSDNEYVQNYGHWVVQKDLESFTNDLSLNKDVGDHSITVGYYRASWSSDDFWTLGNFTPVHNVANGDFLDSDVSCADLQDAGSGSGCWAYGINSAGDATADALYLADSWQVTDDLRFDVGLRKEWLEINYTLDSGPGYPDGVRDMAVNLNESDFAYTAAVNYDISEGLGVFARYSDGFLFPHFDDVREGNLNVNGIKQLEGGVKYSGEFYDLFATVFYNKNDSFSSVVGSTVGATAFKTRSIGMEFEGSVTYEDFNLALIATLQDAEITESTTASDVGNQVLRQPKFLVRLAPSYDLHIGEATATIYGAAQFVGKRFGDNGNTVELAGYTKLDAGVLVRTGSNLFFQVHADNLGDSHGITEGDPRNPSAPNGRPILGRSVKFSIGYDF
ncbi:TonB-dependent siderophore receptor [Paremcibacter congregatus]|uniref:TonB-dependent receptor n=1 Tax=Paremcibacter congregatus TaxID=2043170 RepID=A0A2G4YVQ2_9PROT|nr:TonB-dependent receptor [Paremcibacter congregatus]PHZ86395.1 TonB-dependent receptor [Paremcibacter congregatus]QDE28510.1 TonB-dependent receptor [Paremcibacter congregatus]